KQRIHRYRQSARVGRSALSTPAIFKALAEMLEPFSFLVFSVQAADSPLPTISACWAFGSLHPCHL
ncbi:hypothetical protein AB6E21_21135, partial [Photobacterium swingsii]|uniref:hypothetical protein n=1 Tax=Photobacterium swingsii TaxID=680026 RepID=UPI0035543DB9